MKVFFDTNVIIDACTDREGVNHPSLRLFNKILDNQIVGIICCKQLSDIFYILRDYLDYDKRKRFISLLIDSFVVISDSPFFMKKALHSEIGDIEDAFLDEVAITVKDAYFVTKNIKHFANSKNVILTPQQVIDFLDMDR